MARMCIVLTQETALANALFETINLRLAENAWCLGNGTIVDAMKVAAAPGTKNKSKQRAPEMHESEKGN